jgi:rubredoxin
VAIPLTTGSAPAPAALIDGDRMLIVELRERDPELVARVREAEDSEVERGMVAAGGGRKGKRAEYRCAACGYGIVVHRRPPGCPMCGEARWEHVEWRPSSQSARRACPSLWRPKPATSPPGAFLANCRGADPLPTPGSSRSIARKVTPTEELEQLSPPP